MNLNHSGIDRNLT